MFGLPFFSAGIFMLLAVTAIIPVSNSGAMPPWGWLALTGMGLVFTAVGAAFVFGRAWTTLRRCRSPAGFIANAGSAVSRS